MTRESHVRICERLGVKFPGPTRHRPLGARRRGTARGTAGGADQGACSQDAGVFCLCARYDQCGSSGHGPTAVAGRRWQLDRDPIPDVPLG